MSYQPSENYGIIGNMRTVALVGMNGSIDWYCYPQIDSPSIFGAILDDKKASDSKFPLEVYRLPPPYRGSASRGRRAGARRQ
jgi:GH15 family glucan-1,4-alpha-glucosidase